LNTNRTQLLAHPERIVTAEQEKRLSSCIRQRAQHVPLAYIRNKSEFYGYDFYVDERVLEPRPESETIIDSLKHLPTPPGPPATIIDVGTGSGALAIVSKLTFPDANVIATDISADCLTVARKNARKLSANVKFLQANLLNKLSKKMAKPVVVLANLPYVPDDFQINQAALHEPRLAIFGGLDGLDVYRQLFGQLSSFPADYVLAESLPWQHDQLQPIASRAGFVLTATDDFIQIFRRDFADSSAL
jgi:release factor glutamine methyltransferase